MDEQTSRRLRLGGGVIAATGAALFFIAAGFPPGFTTTYHYSTATGVTQTTSPGIGEVAAYVAVILLGLALMRAAEVKR
jgi:hypothetical protein